MKLAIYGAGGHAKVVVELAKQLGYQTICLFDERWQELGETEGCQVIGGWAEMLTFVTTNTDYAVHVAIGNNSTRLSRLQQLQQLNLKLPTLIHPKAHVCASAILGEGSVVMANATVSVGVSLGIGNIINHNSSVDHDVKLGDGVHICPGAHLAGEVSVGDESMLGISCCVIQGIVIKERVLVGAGAVVVKDVNSAEKVFGNPAKTP
ncbi:NeuD/PglB/VioB family sugar acetyltransferase [Agarivorans litoreus]|uniref:NeuD/PglB/VioB family sugar acetyltransferase n=1 Tax=Agarivorans litoreus TaxID=1510455 RepID=UPI001C7DDE48|nr:NeuD/PglB/VioB family sugar acetyltransferase [Agarivorans litoreus]